MTDIGFALPAYSKEPRANSFYTAICSISGDHTGVIAGFDEYHDESMELEHLPDHLIRTVELGEKWIDVFVFRDRIFVGTPEEIWNAVAGHVDELQKLAPISLLDLAVYNTNIDLTDLIHLTYHASEFIRKEYGEAQFIEWRTNVFIRQRALVELKRLPFLKNKDILSQDLILKTQSNKICIWHPAIEEMDNRTRSSLLGNLNHYSRLLDLRAEFSDGQSSDVDYITRHGELSFIIFNSSNRPIDVNRHAMYVADYFDITRYSLTEIKATNATIFVIKFSATSPEETIIDNRLHRHSLNVRDIILNSFTINEMIKWRESSWNMFVFEVIHIRAITSTSEFITSTKRQFILQQALQLDTIEMSDSINPYDEVTALNPLLLDQGLPTIPSDLDDLSGAAISFAFKIPPEIPHHYSTE